MTAKSLRNWPVVLCLLALMIALFSPILFTDKIVRAPDILNEFYWGVYNSFGRSLWSMLRIDLSSAGWNPYINSGYTNDGGMASMQFLYLYRLIFGLIPAPASVAWFMVLHLFLGGLGTYCYCRLTGCSRLGALFGAVVFALCTEHVSLINAGHVMKIATIAYAPWVFYFLEKGFRSRRWLHYLTAGLVLAFQFFNTHWQISFYTCLAVGVYVILRLVAGFVSTSVTARGTTRVLVMSMVMTLFFLSSAAISLAPLTSWSQDTNRGTQSGANAGRGGLDREEAMMWSLPPEELAALAVPGLFGLSRQEDGDQPAAGQVYYWGRMIFTQTASYFGLLPWLLLPLPLLFRRDRITVAAFLAVVGGLLFAMGKYTPFYQLLYDYLPGISRFRVPKMILFVTALGLSVLTAQGIDLLRERKLSCSPRFKLWLLWVLAFPLLLTVALVIEKLFGSAIRESLMGLLSRPTRYQQGVWLIAARWFNIEQETGIALALASFYALVLLAIVRRRVAAMVGLVLLLVVLIGDLWRVNRHFLVLTAPPSHLGTATTPAMQWLKERQKPRGTTLDVPLERTLLLDGTDPMRYASAKIPVLFTANAVQKRRWQDYLDILSLKSPLPGLMNVRWVVADEETYRRNPAFWGTQYLPVFSGGGEVILENCQVQPKAWLVDHVEVMPDPLARLKRMQEPSFDPARTALVESSPPVALSTTGPQGTVVVQSNQAERLELVVDTASNSLLVLAEKFQNGWRAKVDGRPVPIVAVDHILRGVYLTPGRHQVRFRFDPLPFRVGTWLTLTSFGLYAVVAMQAWWRQRRRQGHAG